VRWRQCAKTGEFIPIDEAARRSSGSFVQGDIESFVSPVDGTVISDRKQLREHNKRNNVGNADEFTPEFFARKAQERADFYQGKHAKEESLKRKREIYERWVSAERESQ
jgi:hypothetical protein